MSFNMEAYRDTKSLFEASHEGIIQGVPFAGTVAPSEDVDDLMVGGCWWVVKPPKCGQCISILKKQDEAHEPECSHA